MPKGKETTITFASHRLKATVAEVVVVETAAEDGAEVAAVAVVVVAADQG